MIPHCVHTAFRIVSSGQCWGHSGQNAMAGVAGYATFQPQGMTRFETAEVPLPNTGPLNVVHALNRTLARTG